LKKNLSAEQWKIYELIVRRFLATLAPDAEVEETVVNIEIDNQLFISKGFVTTYAGWREYYPYYRKEDVVLPALSVDDTVKVLKTSLTEGKTSPPNRFGQGALIQLMERLGLGTKSTRHDIIKKLMDRKYVYGRFLRPTHVGTAVTKALEEYAKTITEPKMTSELESDMSAIADGKKEMTEVVEESRNMLQTVMKDLKEKEDAIGVAVKEALRKHNYIGKCKDCKGDLMIRTSANGKRFIGCSNYPKCDRSYPLPQSGLITTTEDVCECGSPQIKRSSGGWTETMCVDTKCPTSIAKNTLGKCAKCGGGLTIKYSHTGKRFLGCSNFPKCRQTHSLPQKGFLYPTTDKCKVCSSPMIKVVRSGRAWQTCMNKNKHEKKPAKKPAKKRKASTSTSS
jgi:DNA topoisomerase-1